MHRFRRFHSSRRRISLAVYGTQTQDDDKKIPALTKYVPGESVSTEGMELKTLKTKPPVRYTEDTLLGAMEGAGKLVDDEELREAMKERGLGAPSTRSAIIEGLLATKDGRDRPMEPYLRRDGKTLVPSQKLMSLIAFLRENGLDRLTSPALTGEWEHKLRLMERGEYLRPAFIGDLRIHTPYHQSHPRAGRSGCSEKARWKVSELWWRNLGWRQIVRL